VRDTYKRTNERVCVANFLVSSTYIHIGIYSDIC